MSKLAIEQAEMYLTQGKYDKARQSIEKIADVDKRNMLLQRADDLEQKNKSENIPEPRNPRTLVVATFIFTPLITIFLIAFNWGRLGKKEWVWRTIFGWFGVLILGVLGVAGLIFLGVYAYMSIVLNGMFLYGTIVALAIWLLFYPLMIIGQQERAYNVYNANRKRGMGAISNLNYSLMPSLSVLLFLAILSGFGFARWLYSDDLGYKDGVIDVDYPFGITVNDDNSSDDYHCDDFGEGCRIVMDDIYGNLTFVFFDEHWVMDEASDLDGMADAMWQYAHEAEDITPIAKEIVMVNQQMRYDARSITYDEDGLHVIQYFIEDSANNNLFIMVWGLDERSITVNQNIIQNLLDSLIFTPD